MRKGGHTLLEVDAPLLWIIELLNVCRGNCVHQMLIFFKQRNNPMSQPNVWPQACLEDACCQSCHRPSQRRGASFQNLCRHQVWPHSSAFVELPELLVRQLFRRSVPPEALSGVHPEDVGICTGLRVLLRPGCLWSHAANCPRGSPDHDVRTRPGALVSAVNGAVCC